MLANAGYFSMKWTRSSFSKQHRGHFGSTSWLLNFASVNCSIQVPVKILALMWALLTSCGLGTTVSQTLWTFPICMFFRQQCCSVDLVVSSSTSVLVQYSQMAIFIKILIFLGCSQIFKVKRKILSLSGARRVHILLHL